MRLAPDTSSLRRDRRRSRLRLFLLLAVAFGLTYGALGAFRVGPPPQVEIVPERSGIGRSNSVRFFAREPKRGASRIVAELAQGALVVPLVDRAQPTPPGWSLFADAAPELAAEAKVGKSEQPGLAEGPAKLRLTAWPAPAWLRRGSPTTVEVELPVRLVPPALELLSSAHYLTQGGSEVVRYRAGASSSRDGVAVGDRYFPGQPLPGAAPGEKFALFAVPYDVADAGAVRLVAEDDVGNRRELAFVDQFKPAPPGEDDIQLDDAFLGKVVPEILAATPDAPDNGSLLQNYLWINRELRKKNNAELAALAAKSEPAFLWKANFLALPGGQVMSSFADRRTYVYQGKEVDRQDHLGYDLASIAKADVPAANDGVVVLAKYLGIYGNAVVVDHGYGLMTLYAHLSSIAVATGDRVRRGQPLGKSGATGLAAGDHLHFSFLLQGLPVRPAEWWDAHWIQDRLKNKLGNALPFGG